MAEHDDWTENIGPGKSPQDRVRGILRRLLVSTLVGMAMAATAYLCAWYNMRDAYGYRGMHIRTFDTLTRLNRALSDDYKKTGKYPEKLADLKITHPDDIRLDGAGNVVDAWGQPVFQYLSEGNSYTLFSLGRDGHAAARDSTRTWTS